MIDGFKYEASEGERDVRWDESLPGFGLRIYNTGQKSFVLSYRLGGRKRLMALGQYGVLTLDQARNLARVYLVDVIKGIDPLQKRQDTAQGEKVEDLCKAYLERHASVHKKSAHVDARRIARHILPRWGKLKAANIKRSDVAALHGRIGRDSGPYEANRTLSLLSKMFKLARKWGIVPETAVNPTQDLDKFKEHRRDRWVTPEELPLLASTIDQEKNIYVKAALWLYLLTGVRKTELLTAKWEDVDFYRLELCLPETKAGRVHYVPLSNAALTILKRLPRDEGNPYIFPGKLSGHHLVNIEKPWNRIRAKAGIADVRLHDLRRTVGSWMAQAGNSLPLIGRVLNHSNVSTTAIYARLGEDQTRKALEAHGERILDAAHVSN